MPWVRPHNRKGSQHVKAHWRSGKRKSGDFSYNPPENDIKPIKANPAGCIVFFVLVIIVYKMCS